MLATEAIFENAGNKYKIEMRKAIQQYLSTNYRYNR